MAVRYQRPVSHAATWSSRLALFAVLLVTVGAVAHRFRMLETLNFISISLVSVLLSVLAAVLGLIGFGSLWFIGARGGRAAFRGLVMALLLLGPASYLTTRYLMLPPLAEISTDTDTVPVFLAEPEVEPSWLSARALRGPAALAAQAIAYPELSGRRYEGAIDRVLSGVEAVATAKRFEIAGISGARLSSGEGPAVELPDTPELAPGETNRPVNLSERDRPLPVPVPRPDGETMPPASEVTIQAIVFVTPLALPVHLVVRLIEEEETTFVDMRSLLAVAGPDLGLNAIVVQDFLRALDAELLGIAPDA